MCCCWIRGADILLCIDVEGVFVFLWDSILVHDSFISLLEILERREKGINEFGWISRIGAERERL